MNKTTRSKTVNVDDVTHEQPVMSFGPDSPAITNDNLQALARFYRAGRVLTVIEGDVDWLRSWSKWGDVGYALPYLEIEARSEWPPGKMAAAAVGVIQMSTLKTQFTVTTAYEIGTTTNGPVNNAKMKTTTSISLEGVVGRLCGNERLSDVVLSYALHQAAKDYWDVIVFDSLSTTYVAPASRIGRWRCAIFPIFKSDHCCIITVKLTLDGVEASLYDPLGTTSFMKHLVDVWNTKVETFLRSWWTRTSTNEFPVPVVVEDSTPRQVDWRSCGVYCLAKAYSTITEAPCEVSSFDEAALHHLRLRAAWRILVESTATDDISELNFAQETKTRLQTQLTRAGTRQSLN